MIERLIRIEGFPDALYTLLEKSSDEDLVGVYFKQWLAIEAQIGCRWNLLMAKPAWNLLMNAPCKKTKMSHRIGESLPLQLEGEYPHIDQSNILLEDLLTGNKIVNT